MAVKTIVLLSYGLSLSSENYSDLDHYISSAVLATNNGYYIATQKSFNSPQLTWGIKKPYSISYNGGEDTVAYDLTDQGWVLADNSGGTVTIQNGTQWSQLPPNITQPTSFRIVSDINQEIMNDINYSIKQRNIIGTKVVSGQAQNIYSRDPANQFIYLPSVQTVTGDNPITKPSFFVTMSGVDFSGTETVSAQSVAGYTVARRRYVLGFIDGGQKYYCYNGQLSNLSEVVAYFRSVTQAANAGYSPNLVDLSKS